MTSCVAGVLVRAVQSPKRGHARHRCSVSSLRDPFPPLFPCLSPPRVLQTDAAAFATSRGWGVDGNWVTLPLVVDNSPRMRRVGEDGGAGAYADVQPLVAMLARQ